MTDHGAPVRRGYESARGHLVDAAAARDDHQQLAAEYIAAYLQAAGEAAETAGDDDQEG